MDAEIRQFRHASRLQTRGRRGTAIRYSPELRQQAVALARARLDSGLTLVATARLLGLRSRTLARWLRQRPRSAFRRVLLVPKAAPARAVAAGAVLITPQGFRVEGLEPKDVAALLRSLA